MLDQCATVVKEQQKALVELSTQTLEKDQVIQNQKKIIDSTEAREKTTTKWLFAGWGAAILFGLKVFGVLAIL